MNAIHKRTQNRRSHSPRQGVTVMKIPELSPVYLPSSNDTRIKQSDTTSPGSERTSLQVYLQEIGQTRLLTPDEEIVLAKRIQKGNKKAREQMINANLRLVVKIARDYEGLGLPLLDLISEGNIGLMKGVERFRPHKGAKLSTYVSWWIKQAIRRALADQSKTIRLPLHVTQKVSHMRRTALKLRETLDREATDQEIADDLEVDRRRL